MEAENLHLAIEEETFEAEVMYRNFQAQAQAEAVGDDAAAERFRRLREDERANRDQFLTVLRALDPADPAELGDGRDRAALRCAPADLRPTRGPSLSWGVLAEQRWDGCFLWTTAGRAGFWGLGAGVLRR
jgi:hypothetical protein